MNFNKKSLFEFIKIQKKVFDIVRIVDVGMVYQYYFSRDGELLRKPYKCYAVWHKNRRCENCVSAKAYLLKKKLTKFEFVNNEVYLVVSSYIKINNKPFILEMVTKLDDDTLFEAYGKENFIKAIEEHNKKIYVDFLTNVYNRRYFEEQIKDLNGTCAYATIDIDHFKGVNDTYGHIAGDVVLQEVAGIFTSKVRGGDNVIRMGGDEVLLVFHEISKEVFEKRIEEIRGSVEKHKFRLGDKFKLTISVGAVYVNDVDDENNDNEEILAMADEALYESKKSRNKVTLVEY